MHCYRMLGSVHDADDLVQETMLRAWRAYDRYDPDRASVRTWLYRIATNACLNALESRARRPLPAGAGPVFDDPEAAFVPGFEVPWLEPIPADPAASAVERSQLRLALVAALQLLAPRQRAVLILREVLDVPASEVAQLLGMTAAGVNSALQRARARLGEIGVDADARPEPAAEQRAVVDRYVAFFERADVVGLTSLLADDVVLEMPPMWNWYRGVADYGAFMVRVYRIRGRRWRSVPAAANGQSAIVAYRGDPDEGFVVHTLQVFTVQNAQITRTSVFQDPDVLAHFEAPARLDR